METGLKGWARTSIAQRLEHVRVNVAGARSTREFWKQLHGLERDDDLPKGEQWIHYNSVLNYHTHTENDGQRRLPSTDYVLRVCELFDVRPEWLLFGRGEPTEEEEEVGDVVAATKEEAAVELHAGILRAMDAPTDYHPRHWLGPMAEARRRLDSDPETIGRALLGPLEAVGIEPARMPYNALNDYITAMAPVLISLASHTSTTTEEEDNDVEA